MSYIAPARPQPYGAILTETAGTLVRVRVTDWGPQAPTVGPVGIWIDVQAPGADQLLLFVNGQRQALVTADEYRFELPDRAAGAYSLVVEARDASGRVLDRTGVPRIVTVLAQPVEPPPSRPPQGIVTTLVSVHGRRVRVHPDGAVDAGGEGDGPWEQIEVVEV